MDTSPTGDKRSTPELEAWSSHVASSPTLVPTKPSDFDFDLNSVDAKASRSLPNFQLSKCPCAPGCKQACCKSAALLTKGGSNVERPLLSPVGSQKRSDSPVSFGSEDSDEPLIADHDIIAVRQYSLSMYSCMIFM